MKTIRDIINLYGNKSICKIYFDYQNRWYFDPFANTELYQCFALYVEFLDDKNCNRFHKWECISSESFGYTLVQDCFFVVPKNLEKQTLISEFHSKILDICEYFKNEIFKWRKYDFRWKDRNDYISINKKLFSDYRKYTTVFYKKLLRKTRQNKLFLSENLENFFNLKISEIYPEFKNDLEILKNNWNQSKNNYDKLWKIQIKEFLEWITEIKSLINRRISFDFQCIKKMKTDQPYTIIVQTKNKDRLKCLIRDFLEKKNEIVYDMETEKMDDSKILLHISTVSCLNYKTLDTARQISDLIEKDAYRNCTCRNNIVKEIDKTISCFPVDISNLVASYNCVCQSYSYFYPEIQTVHLSVWEDEVKKYRKKVKQILINKAI